MGWDGPIRIPLSLSFSPSLPVSLCFPPSIRPSVTYIHINGDCSIDPPSPVCFALQQLGNSVAQASSLLRRSLPMTTLARGWRGASCRVGPSPQRRALVGSGANCRGDPFLGLLGALAGRRGTSFTSPACLFCSSVVLPQLKACDGTVDDDGVTVRGLVRQMMARSGADFCCFNLLLMSRFPGCEDLPYTSDLYLSVVLADIIDDVLRVSPTRLNG
ncbi:hypothetical protein BX600DRAFT_320703 [Xylariales sp. PMI_506]|nr:hypothetical protein BX600DRAFT_320703 [Xylariales sp. PMI_506]